MPNNTLRNPTKWAAPLGNGYINVFSGNNYLTPLGNTVTLSLITDNLGNIITTNSGNNLQINYNIYSPKNRDAWTNVLHKQDTQWIPRSGQGYVFTSLNYQGAMQQGFPLVPGTNQITDNHGNFITDNLGNNIVTTPVIAVGKYPTAWSSTGV